MLGEAVAWDLMSEMAERMDAISVGLRRCSSFTSSLLVVRVRMKMLPRFSTLHIAFTRIFLVDE